MKLRLALILLLPACSFSCWRQHRSFCKEFNPFWTTHYPLGIILPKHLFIRPVVFQCSDTVQCLIKHVKLAMSVMSKIYFEKIPWQGSCIYLITFTLGTQQTDIGHREYSSLWSGHKLIAKLLVFGSVSKQTNKQTNAPLLICRNIHPFLTKMQVLSGGAVPMQFRCQEQNQLWVGGHWNDQTAHWAVWSFQFFWGAFLFVHNFSGPICSTFAFQEACCE